MPKNSGYVTLPDVEDPRHPPKSTSFNMRDWNLTLFALSYLHKNPPTRTFGGRHYSPKNRYQHNDKNVIIPPHLVGRKPNIRLWFNMSSGRKGSSLTDIVRIDKQNALQLHIELQSHTRSAAKTAYGDIKMTRKMWSAKCRYVLWVDGKKRVSEWKKSDKFFHRNEAVLDALDRLTFIKINDETIWRPFTWLFKKIYIDLSSDKPREKPVQYQELSDIVNHLSKDYATFLWEVARKI